MQPLSNKLQRFLPISVISIIPTLLTNCGTVVAPAIDPPQEKKPTITVDTNPVINTIGDKANESTITYYAKYGITYEIMGKVIAKYPHFDLSIFGKQSIPSSDEHITTYELTSKDGFAKTHIISDPRDKEKKHFYLENLHFYYHSNSVNQINIYMPPQLLANR